MRACLFLSLLFLFNQSGDWEIDFIHAQQKARQEHKYILLNFSGSDWCGPCIRLHDEIFENGDFKKFADSNLVLVNADFPRLKKNKLPKDQQKKNDELAEKYDPAGSFPYTLLLSSEGNVIKTWDGLPRSTAKQFLQEVRSGTNGDK